MNRESVSSQEAAQLLGVSRMTIWRLVKAGELEAFRVSRRSTRIHLAELRRYKASRVLQDVSGRNNR